MELPTHIVAVGGLVRNAGGQILLVQHPRRSWEFPGGMVDPGESLAGALLREIREESGVEAEVENMVGTYSNIRTQPGYGGVKTVPTIVNIDFLCRYTAGELRTSEESLDTRWFTQAAALEAVTDPYIRYRLENMLDYRQGLRCDAFYRPFHLEETYLFER